MVYLLLEWLVSLLHKLLGGLLMLLYPLIVRMVGNLGAMWCFPVPMGFLAAFWLKLPVLAVYCIVNMDEIVKIPAVFLHYKKYIWLRNITRQEEA